MISGDLSYILHSRPFRETSLLLTAMTREHGRIGLVAKGAKSGRKPAVQPFNLLQLSWSGNTELKTLRSQESLGGGLLTGRHLYIGLYLNELLTRILREGQVAVQIFDRYHHLVQKLSETEVDVEPLLRSFEFALLDDMGCGFALDRDGLSGEPVAPDRQYRFDPEQGVVLLLGHGGRDGGYEGAQLLAMAAMNYADTRVRQAAKRLMREALRPHLGLKPLISRELFRGHIGGSGASI